MEGADDPVVMDREIQQANAAEQQPEVVFRFEGSQLRIDHRMSKKVEINLH